MPNIEINNNITYVCDEGDTVLRSALRRSIPLDYECNSGGCGLCKVKLIEGELIRKEGEFSGLSGRDIRKGNYLACQSIPTTDIKIEKDINSNPKEIIPPERCSASIFGVVDISEDVAEFIFSIDRPASYKAGQYYMLDIPGVGERAYSVSSIQSDENKISFIIKKKPGGLVSEHLFDRKLNLRDIVLDGPYGNSYYKESDKGLVLIAGGAGLSPIVSILKYIQGKDVSSIDFFYGVRSSEEINLSYLSNITSGIENFNFIPAVSEADEKWSGERGFIHDVVQKHITDYLGKEYYFCGPPLMTSAVQKLLMLEKSVPFDQLHFDRFF